MFLNIEKYFQTDNAPGKAVYFIYFAINHSSAMKHILFSVSLFFLCFSSIAQPDTAKWSAPLPHSYNFIRTAENKISNPKKLAPFFEKLHALRRTGKGVVRVIHIGDSHLQADMSSSILRNGFRQYFGNAGRGIVFPYQLARSNGAADIAASSNITWTYNRLAHPDIAIATGVTGFGIHANQTQALIHMQLKPVDSVQERFDKLLFFLGKEKACYALRSPTLTQPASVYTQTNTDTPSLIFNLNTPASEFELSKCPGNADDTFSFYGVSMEYNDRPGVIYHTIGVNGAEYDQFTRNGLFWEQLRALNGELFIVALGTNEAQNMNFNEDSFIMKCNAFLSQVHQVAPGALLLITTPAGSYYKKKAPNKIIEKVVQALTRFCNENDLPYWDLYHISGGKAGTVAWKRNKLFSHDLVHYNIDGYQLQGHLFLNAFTGAYNDYLKTGTERKKTGSAKTKKPQHKSGKKQGRK